MHKCYSETKKIYLQFPKLYKTFSIVVKGDINA